MTLNRVIQITDNEETKYLSCIRRNHLLSETNPEGLSDVMAMMQAGVPYRQQTIRRRYDGGI